MDLQTVKFLLKKTKEDYKQIAENFNHTRKYLWKDFEKLDQYVKDGDVILDLGCGNGRFFELFKTKKINYFGVDNCEELIKKAKEKYQSSIVTFLVKDILDLSFESQKFDAIFCIAIFHHIPSKELRIKVLENIKRILKKEGILIMMNWNFYQKKYFTLIIKNFFSTFFSFFNLSKKKLDFGDLFIPWKLKDRIILRYYHAFTTKELSKLFKQTGFKIIEKYYTKKGEKTNFWKGHNIVFVAKR
jgi:ubiquinone/menaquinone biosynthesis C-methylase UbiE